MQMLEMASRLDLWRSVCGAGCGISLVLLGYQMAERPKNIPGARPRKQVSDPSEDLTSILSSKVVGQPNVISVIVPYVEMFQAGLAPENRPVGVFLLLGPTGTGKTRTVEALAETLHGSARNVLKIDCQGCALGHW